jgi:acyl-CoA thioesterase I
VNRARLLLSIAALAAAAPPAGRLSPGDTVPPSCAAPPALINIGMVLSRSAGNIAATGRMRVVAIGSSSTSGTGASSHVMSYPSQLQRSLSAALPGVAVTVLNRGVAGQDVAEEVMRLNRDVIAEHPDLAIWQVGTNAVLRRDDFAADARLLRRGLGVLLAHHIDVVLMDLQYAPRILRRPAHDQMQQIIADAARDEAVGLFHRYALMQRWAAAGQFGQTPMIARDGLHLTDASYGCVAADLAQALTAALGPAGTTLVGAGPRGNFTIW